MKLCVKVGLPGFGDHVMAATWASILIDNGVDARITLPENMHGLFDLPLSDGSEDKTYVFDYKAKFSGGRSIFIQNQQKFDALFNQKVYITRLTPPVKEEEYDGEPFDIAICCQSSRYSVFRDWPHEEGLRMKLAKKRLTFRVLNKEIYTPKTLGMIKQAKAFVVVETGLAHYASKYAFKGFAIASGHAHIDFWSMYNYNHTYIDMPCRNCFLAGEKTSKCMYDIACMKNIPVGDVMRGLNIAMTRSM